MLRDDEGSVVGCELTKKAQRKKKVIVFLHFHKAGGTSMLKTLNQHLTPWKPNRNFNPWREYGEENRLIEFWKYNSTELQGYLDELIDNNIDFVSTEWNFFRDPLPKSIVDQMDLITTFRNPYERFRSNVFFEAEEYADHPEDWVNLDFDGHSVRRQCGEGVCKSGKFHVNYNKPNYYVQMMNGLADVPHLKMNNTHLEVAKQRLQEWFKGIFILEQPETFSALGDIIPGYNPNGQGLPKHSRDNSQNKHTIPLSEDEFREENDLDYQLYEFAVDLAKKYRDSRGEHTPKCQTGGIRK